MPGQHSEEQHAQFLRKLVIYIAIVVAKDRKGKNITPKFVELSEIVQIIKIFKDFHQIYFELA